MVIFLWSLSLLACLFSLIFGTTLVDLAEESLSLQEGGILVSFLGPVAVWAHSTQTTFPYVRFSCVTRLEGFLHI